MKYSKNLRMAAITKRVLVLLAVALILGIILGNVSGYALSARIYGKQTASSEEHNEQAQEENIIYGACNGSLTQEISLNWSVGDLDFKYLNCELPAEQQEFLYYICSAHHLDFSLVMAVIQVESGFNAQAVSSTKDYGLMQINQINHEWLTETLGITDYLNPYQNIYAGVYVLRQLFERYQDVNMVLMAYNMGESGAAKLWEKGIYETDYTHEVLSTQQQISGQLEGE